MNAEERKAARISLQYLVRQFEDVQMMRIRCANRLNKKKDGKTTIKGEVMLLPQHREYLEGMLKNFRKSEKELLGWMGTALQMFPIWNEYLTKIKGVGPTMGAWIISEYDIYIAENASKMIAFTGLAPGRDRRVRGEKSPFNGKLRVKMVGVLADSFIKQRTPKYREIYDFTKNRRANSSVIVQERAKNGKIKEIPWSETRLGHRDMDARRKMIKQFIIDLYVAWRTLEGLPVRKPYAEEYLGRVHGGPEQESTPQRESEYAGEPGMQIVPMVASASIGE